MKTLTRTTLRRRTAALLAVAAGASALAGTPAQSEAYSLNPAVQPARPDLVVEAPGAEWSNVVVIANKGNAVAQADPRFGSATFYLVIEDCWGFSSERSVSPLKPGGRVGYFDGHIGSYGSNGCVTVTVDTRKQVAEKNESNNVGVGVTIT